MSQPVARSRRAALAGLAAAALAAVALPLLPSAPALAVVPTAPAFGPAIEDPAGYDGQSTCSPAPKPGAVRLARLLLATYGTASIGISRPCSVGGQSEHKEGRALDWMLSVRNTAQRHKVEAFLSWLLAPDAYGNQAAMARRLGVMYLGWNNRIWRAYDIAGGWGDLKGCTTDPAKAASGYDTLCHRNHLHISLSWDGAAALTSFWTGSPLAPACRAPWWTPATGPVAGSGLVPVTPVRVLDTRAGTGLESPCRLEAPPAWNPSHGDLVLGVAGVGGVPETGVAAVALRVTASRPSTTPASVTARATADSGAVPVLTLTSSQTLSSTVVVPVASDGTVRLRIDRGSLDLRAEVLGYVPAVPSAVVPTDGTPTGTVRTTTSTPVYDASSAPLAPGESRTVHLAGRAPLPADGIAAVALTLTVGRTTTSDLVTLTAPGAVGSQALLRSSTTRSRSAQALVPTSGDVVVTNAGRSPVGVRLATSGYLTSAPQDGLATFTSLAAPARLVDSARSVGIGPITSSAAQAVQVTGGAVPAGATAVLVSVSVRGGSGEGALALGPVGSVRPVVALTFGARSSASDTALVPLGPDGRLAVSTGSLGAAVRVLVLGYAAPAPALPPAPPPA